LGSSRGPTYRFPCLDRSLRPPPDLPDLDLERELLLLELERDLLLRFLPLPRDLDLERLLEELEELLSFLDFLPVDLDLDRDLRPLDFWFLSLDFLRLLLLDLDDPELLEELDDRDLLDLFFLSLDLLLE